MLSILDGTARVSRAFWFGAILVFIPVAIGLAYLTHIIGTTDLPKERMQAQAIRVSVSAIMALYLFFVAKAIYRGCFRDRLPGIWGSAAILIVGGLAAAQAHFTYDPWFYKQKLLSALSSIPPSEELLAEVENIQSLLPRKISKTFNVESAELRNRELIFAVTAKGKVYDAQVKKTEERMWKVLTTKAPYCKELRTAFENGLWTAVYQVRYDNSTFIARLTPKQCAEGYEHEDLKIKKRI